jgi:hypothetical protein
MQAEFGGDESSYKMAFQKNDAELGNSTNFFETTKKIFETT